MTTPATGARRYQTFEEFWPFYLQEHSNALNRTLHLIGTGGVISTVIAALVTLQPLLLIVAPVCGYGFAWFGHFVVQKNRPATFTYPLWSLAADFKMFFLAVSGKLGTHLDSAGVAH